jgi:hypothetical protein
VVTKDGRMTEIEYRLHWVRTHLKAIGAIEQQPPRCVGDHGQGPIDQGVTWVDGPR